VRAFFGDVDLVGEGGWLGASLPVVAEVWGDTLPCAGRQRIDVANVGVRRRARGRPAGGRSIRSVALRVIDCGMAPQAPRHAVLEIARSAR
jgi:hypothetical protein